MTRPSYLAVVQAAHVLIDDCEVSAKVFSSIDKSQYPDLQPCDDKFTQLFT